MSEPFRPALFREVNERIAEVTGRWHWDDEQGFLCECPSADCTEAVWLTRAQYDAIRSARTRFLAAPGHEVAGKGRVVERHERFVVIETLDDGAERPARRRASASVRAAPRPHR